MIVFHITSIKHRICIEIRSLMKDSHQGNRSQGDKTGDRGAIKGRIINDELCNPSLLSNTRQSTLHSTLGSAKAGERTR